MTTEVDDYVKSLQASVRAKLLAAEIADHDIQSVPDITSYRSLDLASETVAVRLDIAEVLSWGDTVERQLAIWNKIGEMCGGARADVSIEDYGNACAEVSWVIPAPADELEIARTQQQHIRTTQVVTRQARWETIKREYEILKLEFGE